MDYSPIISEVFKLWWVIPILLVITIFKTPWYKGVLGESLVMLAGDLRLPEDKYCKLHNVILPTPDGTTQIDHIIVSQFGIFVLETKNMKGWIFGGRNQAQWTQTIFKKSFKFQNPLRQNYKHVKALEAVLDVPPETIHSVVVFVGESKFKTPMPDNVTEGGGYITFIKSFSELVLSEFQVKHILSQIELIRLESNWKTHRQHLHQFKVRADKSAERKCPKCGSRMILRKAKRGVNSGKEFWGCSNFPKCRVVQNIS
tara:strand:+ start:577 stop:1347 length:771 start_codon:yes stop_codon:yes gene_type:complete